MNDIVRPLTPCGMVGWDQHNQLWCWKYEGEGRRSGVIIADVRGMTCPICNHGWELTSKSLEDQSYMDGREEWAHRSCVIRLAAINDFDFWRGALVTAGFMFGSPDHPERRSERRPSLEAIPNEYWPKGDQWGSGQPWYRVNLLKKLEDRYTLASLGRTLKLGRRKRVYSMHVEQGESPFDRALAEKLFAAEDVTKEIGQNGMMVHAWGREKAQEYLRHFAEILLVARKREPVGAK